MKIKIERDLYDISDRLKELDPDYGVVYDDVLRRFELTKGGVFTAVIPYKNLDERTLEFAFYTRFDNAEQVIKDIDRHNEELEKKRIKEMQDNLENEFSQAMRKNNF